MQVVGSERSFTEIMRCYRLQPQSASHVYRNVMLLDAGKPTESRGDLIKFYNTIFINGIQKYALKFSSKSVSHHKRNNMCCPSVHQILFYLFLFSTFSTHRKTQRYLCHQCLTSNPLH